MPRTLQLEVESPCSVEQFHSAFSDEGYWLARLAASDMGTATLDSLTIGADGSVKVATTFGLVRDRLPKLVAQLSRGDLALVHNETWLPIGANGARGELSAAVPGVPLSANGSVTLAQAAIGSRLKLTGAVELKVPVIGGAIETFIATQLRNGVKDMQTFTTEWITGNA
jgi:Protein of unknown function (DUF2505)